MNEWISVEDELPSERGYNLASNGEYVAELIYEQRCNMWMQPGEKNLPPFDDITHWMPLPPPPNNT